MLSATEQAIASSATRLRSHTRDWMCIAGLCAVTLVLRFSSLGPRSLYRDDTWQALATQVDDPSQIARAGVTAPGYAFFLRGWSVLAGDSALALQLPALLASLLLPAASYLLIRRWGWSRVEALLSSAILVAGRSLVLASVRVKPYLLEAVVSLALIAICIRLTKDVTNSRRWAEFSIAAAVALAFSPAVAPVIAGAVIAAVVAGNRAGFGWRSAAWLAPLALAAGAWYLLVIRPNLTDELHDFWQGNYAPIFDGMSGVRRLIKLSSDFFAEAAPEMLGKLIGVALGLAALAGTFALGKKRQWELLCVLLLPVLIAAGLAALEIAPFGTGRTDVYLLPGVAILAARSLDLAPRRVAGPVGAAAILICGVLVICATPALAGRYPQENLRGAVMAAQAARGDSVRVVVFPEFGPAWALYASEDVHLDRDERSMNAFSVASADDVLVLPGFQVYGSGERNARLRREAAADVAAFVADVGVQEVWIVRSDLFPRDDLPEVYAVLNAAGFEEAGGFEEDHGIAHRWAR